MWLDIEPICHSAATWFGAALGDAAVFDTVFMVSSELLENSVRHGHDDMTVSMDCTLEDGGIRIRLRNPADRANTARLTELLQWVDKFEQPKDAYVAKLQEIADSSERVQGGLGLVRVAYEGRAKLRVDVDPENSTVLVDARLELSARDS